MGTRAPSPPKQLADARTDGHAGASAAVLGTSSWCPTIAGTGILRMDADGVTYTQGLTRAVPVDRLHPVAVHAPRTTTTPVRLPRSWWVLEVDGDAGPGIIAAPLDALAILGAFAGWEPPPTWPITAAGS
jgi:hypothetical protein